MNQRRFRLLAMLMSAQTLAFLSMGCGSSTSASASNPVTASPTSGSLVHDTLNAAGSNSNIDWHYSVAVNGRVQDQSYDDFVSPANATIRTVTWQGAYCESRFSISTVPLPAATSFFVAFYADRNGFPAWYADAVVPASQVPLLGATYAVGQLREQLDQTSLNGPCGSRVPAPSALYTYTLTLATPFQVVQGRRYWLSIRANTPDAGILWGWRLGKPDNGASGFVLAESTASIYTTDLAFSLSE